MFSHPVAGLCKVCTLCTMALILGGTGSARADSADDYVSCLIGRAGVAIHKQEKRDSGKALEVAYKQCKEPKGITEEELEGISDYVNMQVEAMGR